MIQILLADDNEFVRTALVELFDSTGDITVVAECGDGDQVLAAVRETTPDVVVLDLAMPGRTGLQAARVLLSVDPGARSSCSRVTRPRPRSGRRRRSACPATSSREDPAELVDYVRTVAAGGTAWSQAVFRTGDGETGGLPSQNHRPSCGERRHGLGAALNTTNQVLAVVGLAAVLCPLADAAIRRQAEFVADRFAADHGLALELAAALRAMDDGQRVACGWSRRLLASHPTADRRISALLTAMAPTRQPDPGAIRLA